MSGVRGHSDITTFSHHRPFSRTTVYSLRDVVTQPPFRWLILDLRLTYYNTHTVDKRISKWQHERGQEEEGKTWNARLPVGAKMPFLILSSCFVTDSFLCYSWAFWLQPQSLQGMHTMFGPLRVWWGVHWQEQSNQQLHTCASTARRICSHGFSQANIFFFSQHINYRLTLVTMYSIWQRCQNVGRK